MAKSDATKARDGFHVYVIHAEAEYEDARYLCNDLFHKLKVHAALTEDVEASSNPQASLRQALQAADVVITLLTPLSVSSSHVLEQLGAAWALEKLIIPVVTRRELLNDLPQSVIASPLLTEVASLTDETARSKVVERVRQARDSFLVSA